MKALDKLREIIRAARRSESEGLLDCKVAYSEVMRQLENLATDMTIADEREQRAAIVPPPRPIPTMRPTTQNVAKIIGEVADKHDLTTALLLGPSRQKHIAAARHEAFWRIRHETGGTFGLIGKFFYRDHSTVLHGITKYEKRVASRDKVAA